MHLDLAVSAKAGGDLIEIAIVVAGMADELKGAGGWHGGEDLGEGRRIEITGSRDTKRSVGRMDSLVAELRVMLEGWTETVQDADLKAALKARMRQSSCECWLKGIADGCNAVTFEDTKQRTRDGGKEMGVFVGIGMRNGNACTLESVNLSLSLALDLGFADLAAQDSLNEIKERRTKGFAIGPEKGRDGFGRRGRSAVGEDDVAADAERGSGAGDGDGVVEGRAGGHESGGGEDTGGVELGDGAVDALSEAEVICVDDEAGRHEIEEAVVVSTPPALL